MLRILLIQPGSTDFDEQGRIKGSLDIPLSDHGAVQARQLADELAGTPIESIYAAPCRSATQTAEAIAAGRRVRVKQLPQLRNVDHGLWHGKRIDEVRQTQPRVYREWQEHPAHVCPPGGESMDAAQRRARQVLGKLFRKHRGGTIAVIAPEPLASVIRSVAANEELGDLWQSECDRGRWEQLEVEPVLLPVAE